LQGVDSTILVSERLDELRRMLSDYDPPVARIVKAT